MTTRPSLVRSIPFWALIAGSAASAGYGAFVVTTTLDSMTATLLEGTATGVDVYVGQSTAVVGAVLIGAGVLGLLIALAVAAASTLRAGAVTASREQTAEASSSAPYAESDETRASATETDDDTVRDRDAVHVG